MSPETDSNDHVPLEFLLGARLKHYYQGTSTGKNQGRVNKTKRIFAPAVHPRRREEQARQLLQRVLDQNDPRRLDGPSESEIRGEPDKPSLLKALTEAGQEVFDSVQLSLENTSLSPARIKTLQQLRDEELRRQNQRVASFHGYEEDRPFLGVTGAAAHVPRTNTKQLRDLKAKKQLKDEERQELLEVLREQQTFTRTALHQHQQLTKVLQRQKHPGVVSTSLLSLDCIEKDSNIRDEIAGRKTMPPLQLPESYYRQHQHQELEHPRRPALATLNLDARALSPKNASGCDRSSLSTNEEDDSDADEDSEQVGKRLSDRQREVFANSAANGLFLGGGFISKTKDKKINPISISNSGNEPDKAEVLDAVLGAQSASILPLAEANKPALRRREASAGRRHPKILHKAPNNG
ncbi:hypothetical protein L917_05961 [Phytophthora nicotianae]|uniref:Uncharacterized protein n=1 Tax=Phytophthora nicotianae TaxID=4792 RepID=W2LIN2_PHYNI|nr:hypothetical protein L917_05961 [Phytophthora nicotianae]